MPAVQETIEAVKAIDVDQVQIRLHHRDRVRAGPQGPERGHHRAYFGQEGRAGLDAGMAPRRLSPLADLDEPTWARVSYPKIDFQDIHYYAAPKSDAGPKSLDEVDPELLRTYEKLGIPLKEQEILAGVPKAGEPSPIDEGGERQCLQVRPRRSRRGVQFGFGRHHLQGRTGARPASSSARSRKRSASIRNWSRSISARSCRFPTISTPR